ncbi:myb-like protein P [Teleopsis dalmanni]|uniref:myb-like protein P n=1 Tax=Teleopsis dalmanni TaxID=139649 RepID=UPI0018CF30DF|nr:myb-like protein P [Teleopsis dalmanni]
MATSRKHYGLQTANEAIMCCPQMLKAFYVDLLVPLETNLEKDTKVVQHEQKKFLQQHKVRMESYQKAVSTMKKQRKKKASPENTEKELRSLQILEDQKKKLDAFCEQSYKNAMTQERRRYGFVLERQCSIAKHWMAYHNTGKSVIDNNLENWQEIAASREVIPTLAYETNLNGHKRIERIRDADENHSHSHNASQLKKARSVDAPYGDMRTLHETSNNYTQNSLPRAKSDFNLTATTTSSNDHTDHTHWDQRPVVKALYAYMPSGENQLPFDEGDKIALVGSKAKGWQFGENLRTQMFGWFPIAYTNAEGNEKNKLEHERNERNDRYENMHFEHNNGGMRNYRNQYMSETHMDTTMESDSTYRRRNNSAEESSPTRMFGDTINFRNQKKYRPQSNGNPRPGPPPTLPAPVPTNQNSNRMLNTSQSFCAPNGAPSVIERRKHKAQNGQQTSHTSMNHVSSSNQSKPTATAKASLHSSADSGFSNEPPPQPEVDYSDEEQTSRVPIRRRADTNSHNPREVASWTLNRNFRNSVDSQIDDRSLHTLNRHSNKMRYDLIASDDEILHASSGGIKRTKSFWKFGGRHDDILAGMSLWQHRDLVAAPNLEEMRDELNNETEQQEHDFDKNATLTKSNSNSNSNSSSTHEKRRKDSITSMEMYDDDENIYGMSPVMQRENIVQQRNSTQSTMQSNFTPKSRMKIMKTIEIDIENPTESERLSTIKRGQKEYQKEYRESGMSQQAVMRNSNGREQELKKNANMNMQNRNSSNNASKKLNDMKSNHHSTPQTKSQPAQSRAVLQDMLPSTEDEADSDDNGTLKMSDVNNFFDDLPRDNTGGGLIMKTVKRKDILKQYYTSEDESDDAEIKSTSSDPYDCIVINDHLVRKDDKHRRQMHNSYQEHQMEFQTFRATTTSASQGATSTMNKKKNDNRITNGGSSATLKQQQKHKQQQQQQHREQQQEQERYINNSNTMTRNSNVNSTINTPTATILPRTRLMKCSNTTSMTLERTQHKSNRQNDTRENSASVSSDKDRHYGKTYGPWYDFWDQQNQHTLVSQKSMSNSKMKSNGGM